MYKNYRKKVITYAINDLVYNNSSNWLTEITISKTYNRTNTYNNDKRRNR